MSVPIRLVTAPGPDAESVRFQLAFAAPVSPEPEASAPAWLETGDGHTLELGELCAPTAVTWRDQRLTDLGSHRYASPGPFSARLRWGDRVAEAVGEPGRSGASQVFSLPETHLFSIKRTRDNPLQRIARVHVAGLAPEQSVRLDGDAGQVHVLAGSAGAEQTGEWRLSYPKLGGYVVTLDLLDADGFWLAGLARSELEITLPAEATAPDLTLAELPQPPAAAQPAVMATDVSASTASPPAWLPYRYGQPALGWQRVYTAPGGGQVSRVVGPGVYLSIRAEVSVAGAPWFQTAGGDWIPASAVSLFTPSELRGVELNEPAPPPPPPPPTSRRGVVTADVLNVRGQPGVRPDNPPIDQLLNGAEVGIYEDAVYANATWYRIGEGRWVHSGWVQLLEETPPTPPPPPPPEPPPAARRGVVTADALNVRSQPGVRGDNPPVGLLYYGAEVTIHEEQAYGDATWYRIGDRRWVHGGWVRIIEGGARSLAAPASSSAERPALPIGWVVAAALNVRGRPGVSNDNPPLDQVLHNQALPILDTRFVAGVPWYRIGDGRWVEGTQIGVARPKLRPLSIGPTERWVGVCLEEQTLVAYEGDRPVYAALLASGLAGMPTVQGIFRTWRRLATGVMAGGDPQWGSYYYIEDVTWTCYFYSGYALHTAYWHDAFGAPRSHGCVNLSPHDAWWVFQWSAAGGPNSPAVYVYWA
jgi:hypothetical protein